jgi:hypothetical protein
VPRDPPSLWNLQGLPRKHTAVIQHRVAQVRPDTGNPRVTPILTPHVPSSKWDLHHGTDRSESCGDREEGWFFLPGGSGTMGGDRDGLIVSKLVQTQPTGMEPSPPPPTAQSPCHLLTSLMGASLARVTLGPVTCSVEGRDGDQVFGVASKILQSHHGLREEEDLHFLCFVLVVCLPVVNLSGGEEAGGKPRGGCARDGQGLPVPQEPGSSKARAVDGGSGLLATWAMLSVSAPLRV